MELPVPLPPPQECQEILEWFGQEQQRMNALIDQVKASLELLQERRSALISAAVTGQIDVRGLAEAVA
ncbi:hypothetical protein [Synechococcus elongatus]|uniref:hypothetical protein n=1 Tax=Synechococcus elongatus TaxID=32046 RepID=UPI0030D569E2